MAIPKKNHAVSWGGLGWVTNDSAMTVKELKFITEGMALRIVTHDAIVTLVIDAARGKAIAKGDKLECTFDEIILIWLNGEPKYQGCMLNGISWLLAYLTDKPLE